MEKREKDMTSALQTKEFVAEELPPGEYARQARETWKRLTTKDKFRLGLILGFDQVIRIEQLHTR